MSQTEVQLIKNGAVVDADINGMSSSKLSGALPAISGASLTNLPAGPGKAQNLIINGAMQVAQRGTSYTGNGYGSVDRFKMALTDADDNPTQSQADVASGTTPYSLGFRKSYKITNGNQTGGAGSNDLLAIDHKIEAQDIANSGWNYVSSSSNITISYWVKSSVAQNFFVRLLTKDGTPTRFAFQTGSLSANTWTKITKTIPGNSNLQFDNDNGSGLEFRFYLFAGTDRTDNSVSLDAWATHSSTANTPDQTSTFYTTNDATFEITGVQLEVGDSATDFEHKTFGEELALCQRYCQKNIATLAVAASSVNMNMRTALFSEMRASPTVSKIAADGSSNLTYIFGDMISVSDNSTSTPSITSYSGNQLSVPMQLGGFDNLTQYRVYRHEPQANLQAIFLFSAEL